MMDEQINNLIEEFPCKECLVRPMCASHLPYIITPKNPCTEFSSWVHRKWILAKHDIRVNEEIWVKVVEKF